MDIIRLYSLKITLLGRQPEPLPLTRNIMGAQDNHTLVVV